MALHCDRKPSQRYQPSIRFSITRNSFPSLQYGQRMICEAGDSISLFSNSLGKRAHRCPPQTNIGERVFFGEKGTEELTRPIVSNDSSESQSVGSLAILGRIPSQRGAPTCAKSLLTRFPDCLQKSGAGRSSSRAHDSRSLALSGKNWHCAHISGDPKRTVL